MTEDQIVKLGITSALFTFDDGNIHASIMFDDGGKITELTRDFPADTTSFSSSGTALADVVNGQLAPNQLACWGKDAVATDMPDAGTKAPRLAVARKSAARKRPARKTATRKARR